MARSTINYFRPRIPARPVFYSVDETVQSVTFVYVGVTDKFFLFNQEDTLMRKALLVSVATIGLLAGAFSPAYAIQWKALAVNSYGWGYAERYDVDDAKAAAIAACERKTARRCDLGTATSVPMDWVLVGSTDCQSSGGSQYDMSSAQAMAAQKSGSRYCAAEVVK